jgi:hypothetical protein
MSESFQRIIFSCLTMTTVIIFWICFLVIIGAGILFASTFTIGL